MSDASENAEGPSLGAPAWILLATVAAIGPVFATGFSQFEAIKEYLLTTGVGLAVVVWGFTVALRGRLQLVAGRVVSMIVAFGLYAVLAIVWSEGATYAAPSAIHMLLLAGAVVVVSAPLGREIRFDDLAVAVAAGVVGTGVFGLLDLAGLGLFTPVWDPPGAPGAFDAMEFASAYYAVALPILAGAAVWYAGAARYLFGVAGLLGVVHFGLVAQWLFVFLLLGAAAVVGALLLTAEGAETAAIVAPMGVVIGTVLLSKFLLFQFAPAPAVQNEATSLPMTKSAFGVGDTSDKEGDVENPTFSIGRMESVRTVAARGYLAQVAFSLVGDRPLIGHGPGGWWRMQTKHPHGDHPAVQSDFSRYPAYRSPHSAWATLWVEYGAIGFGLFVLWLISAAAVAIGGLKPGEVRPDIIAEQASLGTAALAGAAVATVTPLVELAPSALLWVVAIAVLTVHSAELNAFEGASMRWELGGDEPSGQFGRMAAGVLPGFLAIASIGVGSVDTVSQLHRGWGDHLMLRTYYERAMSQYAASDSWYPARGDVLYNMAEAESRLGVLEPPSPESDDEKESDEAGEEADPAKSKSGSGVRRRAAGGGDAGAAPDAATEGKTGPSPRAEPADQTDGESASEDDEPSVLGRARELRPYDTRILNLTAESWLREGYSRKALRVARRAVDYFPNGIEARKTLASALQGSNKFDAAAKQLLAILERDPPSRDKFKIHYQLGRLYLTSLEELQPAKEHFQKAKKHVTSVQERNKIQDKIKRVESKIEHERKVREGKAPKNMSDKPPSKQKGRGGAEPEVRPPYRPPDEMKEGSGDTNESEESGASE